MIVEKTYRKKTSFQDIAMGSQRVSNTDLFYETLTLNLAEAGNLEPATTFLKKTTSLKPDHVGTYCNLGTALQSRAHKH